ncbi:MAG: hypothetical protein ABSE69_17010 [Roseiarcus sp.]|jgi:hypothetical protein
MADRSTVVAPAPGAPVNYVVILSTAWQCQYGIRNPANTGSCLLTLVGLDATGNSISHGAGDPGYLDLSPGASSPLFVPPAGSVQLVMLGDPSSTAQATLEYDTPSN